MPILGLGSDIIECLRIAQMIERHGELFIARVYTEHEIAYCAAQSAATQHYASHWAAKEAVLKAMGTGLVKGMAWRDIEIRCRPPSTPTAKLYGAARDLFERSEINRIHLTISHCRSHATAHAIAEA